MISCASSEYRYSRYALATSCVPFLSAFSSTMATLGCARMLTLGVISS